MRILHLPKLTRAVRPAPVTPVQASTIHTNMQVYRLDGEHLGKVTEARDREVLVRRRWRRAILIPIDRVLSVGIHDLTLTPAA